MTSAIHSTFTLINEPIRGQILHFLINAADVRGKPKTTGGDTWHIYVSSVDEQFYTTGRFYDHHNGSYSVFIFGGWNKTATIQVKLAFTSHATNYLNTIYWPSTEYLHYWNGTFSDGNKTEFVTCYLESEWDDQKDHKSLCAYTRPIAMGNRTALVCNKPNALPCSSFYSYIVDARKTNTIMGEFGKGKMWLFDRYVYSGIKDGFD